MSILLEATVPTMQTLLGDMTTVGEKSLDVVGKVVNTIVSNPLLLMTTGILFLGAAVGILGRLLSKS